MSVLPELTDEDVDPTPKLWVQCDCGTAYVIRRGMSFTKGWIWCWQSDCKHPKRETHEAEMWTAAGRYEPIDNSKKAAT